MLFEGVGAEEGGGERRREEGNEGKGRLCARLVLSAGRLLR